MTGADPPLAPAFYAAPAGRRPGVDWWALLHPPYTLWHLSYVVIGATIAPAFHGGHLVATLVAFFLAVGVCAHALDELHGRPLRTAIPGWALVTAAAVSLGAAVTLGLAGMTRVGPGLLVFIAGGAVLTCGYNLELLGGRLHNDTTFAAAWGAFPVITAYHVQAGTLHLPALAAAAAAWSLSNAQRRLSTPARELRRRVTSVEGSIVGPDGARRPITIPGLLAPLEAALKAMTWGVVGLAAALVLYRLTAG